LDEYFSEDDVKIIMIMAPEPLKNSGKEEVGYICVTVRPSVVVTGGL
jgi:hypothetical protein